MPRHSVRRVNVPAAAHEAKATPRGDAPASASSVLTIGRWKNWSSCASSKGRQRPVLDQTLAAAGFRGIVVSATTGNYPAFGSPFYLVLHGSPTMRDRATDCSKAVALLSMCNFAGEVRACDPAFNVAAHLVAAELNYTAGAEHDREVTSAINQAVVLLGKYRFNGSGYTGMFSDVDVFTLHRLATTLDHYNNQSHRPTRRTQGHG